MSITYYATRMLSTLCNTIFFFLTLSSLLQLKKTRGVHLWNTTDGVVSFLQSNCPEQVLSPRQALKNPKSLKIEKHVAE